MNQEKGKEGFTFIELLVVIAVIGLISSIILMSLERRQRNAEDQTIIGELHQVRSQAEAFYVNHEGYQELCASDQTLTEEGRMGELEDSIESKGGELECGDSTSDYAVSSSLNQGDYWCVDSHGASHEVNSLITTTSCPE